MPIMMNLKSMNQELEVYHDDIKYIAKCWGTISNYTPILMKYCVDMKKPRSIGITNIYTYVALSRTDIKLITLNSLDTTRATAHICIPLDQIRSIKAKYGILKSSLDINFEKEKIHILFINSSTGTDFVIQKECVKRLCDHFN